MAINLERVTSEQIVDLASELHNRERLRAILGMLELKPALESLQLKKILETVERILSDVLLEEEDPTEEQAKYEYKDVRNNYYAYIKQWNREPRSDYLGPVRFLPGVKYQLTHKSQSGVVHTLIGLGLQREKEQIFLKIKHLTPQTEVKSYLYYDSSLRFPRRPQEDCIDTVFSKREWKIECLGPVKTDEIAKGNVLSSSILEKLELEAKEQLQANQTLVTPSTEKDNKYNQESNELVERVVSVKSYTPRKILQTQKTQLTIPVKNSFIPQVVNHFKQWEALSQAVPTNPQLQLINYADRLVISSQEGELLVEYDITSQTLLTQSAQTLLTTLQTIALAVASSKIVSLQQQTIASRLLPKLQFAPLENSIQLLAYLFDL